MAGDRVFTPLDKAKPPFFVGVDLGGTNIKAGVVDDEGSSLSWCTTPTEAHLGPEEGARRMAQSVFKATQQAGLTPEQIVHVGLGSPGTHDIPAGLLLDPPNLPGWINFPIRDRVQTLCGRPLTFANDANCAAYGEYWIGSGREFSSLVLFTLGTGIGSGIILDDMQLVGAHSHGGECGHAIIDYQPDARLCGCGNTGHLEAYCSATAVIKRTQEAIDARASTSLTERLAAGAELTPLLVAKAAEEGDEFSLQIILDTAMYLAVGVVNVMHTVNPEGIILGGAMTFGGDNSELGRRFMQRVQDEVQRRGLPLPASRTKIKYATLGGDAGYIGAAGVARVAHRAGASRA